MSRSRSAALNACSTTECTSVGFESVMRFLPASLGAGAMLPVSLCVGEGVGADKACLHGTRLVTFCAVVRCAEVERVSAVMAVSSSPAMGKPQADTGSAQAVHKKV